MYYKNDDNGLVGVSPGAGFDHLSGQAWALASSTAPRKTYQEVFVEGIFESILILVWGYLAVSHYIATKKQDLQQ